jgi:putative endonuclease
VVAVPGKSRYIVTLYLVNMGRYRSGPPPLAGQANGADCHRLWRGAARGGINLYNLYNINNMKYYTYILKSQKNNRYYIGSCEDISKRLHQHNSGKVKSTKNYLPYFLVHYEQYDSRQVAYKRELQIKSYKGGQAFKNLVT